MLVGFVWIFFDFFFVRFCAYGVAVVVGCCCGGEVGFCRGCGGEVEGVGLWIGVVEA